MGSALARRMSLDTVVLPSHRSLFDLLMERTPDETLMMELTT